MGWFTRDPPEPVKKEPEPPVPASPTLMAHEERLLALEIRLRAIDVEIEDFISKVSAAAKRAYKREADAGRKEPQEPETTDRASLKAAVLKRMRSSQGGT